jgi:class 3 adenylate cyclase/YHS domain-containing protein
VTEDYLTLDELSLRTGEDKQRLLEWQSMGIIGAGQPEVFLPKDVGRARLIHDMLHFGIDLKTIAAATGDETSVFNRFLDEIGAHQSRQLYPLEEACEIAGIDLEFGRTLLESTGIEVHGNRVDAKDIEFFRSCRVALEAGYPQDALIQVLRVYSDAMARVAEVGSRSSHFHLHQPLKDQGLNPDEIMERLSETSHRIEPMVEPAILYFHHKGAERAEWEDMIMHLEEEAGLADQPLAPGQVRRAIMFVDLASFTPLAEAMGDVRAAEILDRFGLMTRRAVRRCHGRIVKQIGDAFMIVFPECYSAVSCGLELEEVSSTEPHFPAIRVGLHYGAVLYREGDYIGSNVNIASRLVEEAHRHQFLLTDEVRRRAKAFEGVEFMRLGRRRLKGLAAEVEVFEAKSVNPAEVDRVIDPVCGMEMSKSEVAANLTLDSREHNFCSEDCLGQFVRSPSLYTRALQQSGG